jgi:hypothetical protein
MSFSIRFHRKPNVSFERNYLTGGLFPMSRKRLLFAALVCSFVPTSLVSAQVQAPAKGIEPAYASPDFAAAIILHPQRIAKSPSLAGVPQDQLLAPVLLVTGIDPRKVERAIIYVDPFPGGNVAFLPAAVVRLAEGGKGQEQLTAAIGKLQEASHQGQKYFQGERKMAGAPICGLVSGDRTLVIATEPTLHKMLAAKEGQGPMAETIKGIDGSHDLILIGIPPPMVQSAAKEILERNKDQLPPPLAKAPTIVDHLGSFIIAVDLQGATFLEVQLTAKSAESAAKLHDFAKTGVDAWKRLHATVRNDIPIKPLQEVLDQATEGMAVKQTGSTVVVSVKMPKSLPELLNVAAKTVLDK